VEERSGRRWPSSFPYDLLLYLKAVNEGVPIVIGAARSAPAERLIRLTASAFGEDGLSAAPAAAEARKSGGLFRRRR
jgi:hypothetical protein